MKIQKKKSRKAVLIVLLIVAFILAGGATYWYLDTNGFFGRSDKDTGQQDNDDNQINNGTSNETPSDDNKGNNEKPPVETDSEGKKIARLVIVDASQYDNIVEVRAGVTNLAEENGKCEFTFTKDTSSLTRTSDAIFSGTGIDCQTLEVPVENFPTKGAWKMVVKYSSATAAGISEIKTINVK
ncbi:MAG: hypothetical protein LBQ11_00850 [Candidatus Nomurabacteria bacterium]|jgi:flagellar basal body-associated protein FliL|nr:hypothetical protein [Candidatus Nomurabacteria bacterium]